MDWSFLYGWDGYYFLQGFVLDIKLLVANTNPIAVIICFIVSFALLLFIERKHLKFGSVLFSIASALYVTFLLTVTVFGRSRGNNSSWSQLFVTYARALSGDDGAKFDVLYNIVLYIPVGLFISHYNNTKLDIIILVSMPIVIELTQLVTTKGVFELTDIINNFIGGLIGLGIARMIAKLFKFIRIKRKGDRVERTQ